VGATHPVDTSQEEPNQSIFTYHQSLISLLDTQITKLLKYPIIKLGNKYDQLEDVNHKIRFSNFSTKHQNNIISCCFRPFKVLVIL